MASNLHTILQTRHNKLATTLHLAGLRALALNPGPSLTYLTGLHFHLSERPVIAFFTPHNPPVIVLPQLEAAKLTQLPFPIQAFPYGENPSSWLDSFRQAMRAAQLEQKKIGVEPRYLRLLEFELLQQAASQVELVSAEAAIAELRMYKDENELQAMRQAAQLAQQALQATLPCIKPGASERQIAAELTLQLLRHGSEPQLPFFPIIASGPNSANPHAFPGERCLAEGDLLVIDWGANVNGYYSDITRTFAIGAVEPEFERIADLVLAANQAGQAVARPGITAGAVDRAARAVITEAGYGEYFIHRTGHGLGMETHEEPYIRGDNELRLQSGMTFTIEPGIYLPERGGVRIEDDVVITAQGVESLTDLPRELIRLG